MDENATIGELIRERRLAQGYSLGQLATKLGQTAAVVRNWEKGTENPDTMLLPGLADALSVEADALESLMTTPEIREVAIAEAVPGSLPTEVELEEEPAPVDQVPVAPAPATEVEPEADAGSAEAVAPEAEPEAAAESAVPVGIEDEPASADIADAEDEVEGELEPAAVVGRAAVGLDERPAEPSLDRPGSIEDMPTEAIPPPVSSEPKPTRHAGVVADSRPVPAQAPEVLGVSPYKVTNPFLAFFDPKKRWLYYLRTILTVIVLLVLLRVFFWALAELWDAIQQVFDSFRSTDEVGAILPEP